MTETSITTYYVIRQRGTPNYMPQMKPSKSGYTSMEPTDKSPPRLFSTKSAATSCLNWWLKGVFIADTDTDEDEYGNPFTIRTGPILSVVVPERHLMNMEVIVCQLVMGAPIAR